MRYVRSFTLALLFIAGTLGAGGTAAVAQPSLPSQSVGMVPTSALSPSVKSAARTAAGVDAKATDGGGLAKVGLELSLLYHQYEQQGAAGVRALREVAQERMTVAADDPRDVSAQVSFPVSADGRRVGVAAVPTGGDRARLHRDLRALGLDGGAVVGNLVAGRLPVEAIAEAAQLGSLRGMVPTYARTRAGSVESEADTSHGAFRVRQAQGVDGTGQKICALSDSYNRSVTASTSEADDVASGDLPGPDNPEGNTTPVDVVNDEVEGSDEGRAMLQLIHDIAPGAELGFHTAFGGYGNFVNGVRALADPTRGDCDIIVDDVGYSIEPFYQDGPLSVVIDSVVAEGTPYFSSAGNDANNSYEAPFRNSGVSGILDPTAVRHDFDPSSSVDTRQQITVEPDGSFQIFSFQWTDPSALLSSSAGADTDLDVALVDQQGQVVAQSALDSDSLGLPVEFVNYQNTGSTTETLNLVIEKAAGPDPDEVKYVYTASGATIVDDYGEARSPTVYGHPNAEGAMATAASGFFNTAAYNPNLDSSAVVNLFSSKGGVPVLFDENGNEIGPVVRDKPDVTGTDFVDNTFFGSDIELSDPDPHPNFSGTSAAAPNVAAIGALILQARPEFSPAQVYDRLESTAVDVRFRQAIVNGELSSAQVGAGFDVWSGHGFVDAERAVPKLDIFDVQAEANSAGDEVTLSWTTRSGITIPSYDIDRRYFDGPFEDLAQTSTNAVTFGSPGLGVYTYRIQWTRADGVSNQRTLTDTLGFQGAEGLAAAATDEDEEGRKNVELSWSVPSGPNTANFTYRIERRDGVKSTFQTLATTSSPGFTAERQPPGAYRYRVTAQDGQGNEITTAAKEVRIGFQGAAVAIGPYPNPTRGDLRLDLTAQQAQTVTVEIYNTLGQRVYRDERSVLRQTATPVRLDVQRFGSGVYFLRLRGTDFNKTRKFVVAK